MAGDRVSARPARRAVHPGAQQLAAAGRAITCSWPRCGEPADTQQCRAAPGSSPRVGPTARRRPTVAGAGSPVRAASAHPARSSPAATPRRLRFRPPPPAGASGRPRAPGRRPPDPHRDRLGSPRPTRRRTHPAMTCCTGGGMGSGSVLVGAWSGHLQIVGCSSATGFLRSGRGWRACLTPACPAATGRWQVRGSVDQTRRDRLAGQARVGSAPPRTRYPGRGCAGHGRRVPGERRPACRWWRTVRAGTEGGAGRGQTPSVDGSGAGASASATGAGSGAGIGAATGILVASPSTTPAPATTI